jgi:hypothetical protein
MVPYPKRDHDISSDYSALNAPHHKNACDISMENLRVIRVKVVAPEKPLDVNTFPKITLILTLLFTIVSKYLCVDMASCNIQKYFMLI